MNEQNPMTKTQMVESIQDQKSEDGGPDSLPLDFVRTHPRAKLLFMLVTEKVRGGAGKRFRLCALELGPSLVIGPWSFIDHWSLVIGHWSSDTGHSFSIGH